MRRSLLVLTLAWVAPAAALTPYELECEARQKPLGVDSARPRLGWKLRGDARGERQSAYRILVATRPELLEPGKADLWDSGRVASDETAWIPYRGKPLVSFQRCFWKVQVWDAAGKASEWSPASEWTMGVLQPAAWKAGWIASRTSELRSGPLPVFRKEVTIARPVRRAVLISSAPGFHEVRINGERAGDHELATPWTNFRETLYYDMLDVTGMLRQGRNALAVLVGNGFYNVVGGRYAKFTGSFGRPRFILQLHVEYGDGTAEDLGSNGTWRVADGPITFTCIYGGEDFDARLEPEGWDRPGFDDSQWAAAAGIDTPGGKLRGQTSPPVRVTQVFETVRVTQPKPGVKVYDLGQNFAGRPVVTASGPAGAKVKLIPGELLDDTGLVSQRSSGGPVYFEYTLKGKGRETLTPRFTYYGFRYVQVEATATVEKVAGQFLHADAPRAGSFASSNELFNRIHALIDAAVRSNLNHVLTDCPHREKLGWLEVAHLLGPSLMYNWDLRTYWPKVIRDTRDAQTHGGLFTTTAPEYAVFGPLFRDSPEWGSAGVLLPLLAWQWYGDTEPMRDSFEAMKSYARYLGAKARDGIVSYGLGDWYDIGPKPPGVSQLTPLGLTATAIYYADLDGLSKMALALGKPTEAASWAQEARKTAAAFQRAFYKDGSYATGSQTSLAMPLVLGLAPPVGRGHLLEKLVADVRSRGNHPTAGDVGHRYVIAALTAAGRGDVLFDMTKQTQPPSYGAQLAAGATALTEAWDGSPRSSQNHCMLGHIEEWFYGGLAGIRPDTATPGLKHVRIEPQPVGDLTWVKASWKTFRGPIAVEWRRDDRTLRLTVDIPPGVTADVGVPARNGAKVVRRVKVGSGRYEFDSTDPAPPTQRAAR